MEIRFKFLFLFLSIVQISVIVQGDEFVTLWAPKTILKSQTYSAVILPTKLQGKTEVALQFRNYNLTKQLVSGKAVRIEYPDKVKGSKTEVNLIMTLHVDEPIDKNQVASICSTKSLKIKIDNREHVTFIQTDKPIYKPGDEVRVKILVVDRDIKPFHMNNIDVDIIDPLNRTIAHFDDLDDENLGVVEFRFSLGTQTVLGDWTIQVKIDRSQRIKAVKSFLVQKFVLPSFEVFVDIPDQHVLASSQVTVSFYAKYPFGEFVTGNAELSIIGVNDKKVYLQNNFTNVDGVQKLSYKLKKDLSISNNTETEFEAVVTFTEPESKLSYKKSTNFYVHTGKRHKIVAKHPEKFLAGQAFTIKVIITDWKDQRISISSKHANLTMEVKIDEHLNLSTISLDLLNGTADYDFMVPEGTTGLKLWIEYLNADKYEKTIEMGNVKVGIDDLEVYHVPKYPKLNQTIDIFIKSVRNLDNVLALVKTRFGPVKSGKIECRNQKTCQFKMTINEKLMPQSTIIVYHVKDHVNIFVGRTEVETENLGGNYLNLKLSSDYPKPKQQLKMTFSTKSNSKIHLLAFDKRFRSLKSGNDITKDNVTKALADYDGDYHLLIDDMTSWHECTAEELTRLGKGREAIKDVEVKKMNKAKVFEFKRIKYMKFDGLMHHDDYYDGYELKRMNAGGRRHHKVYFNGYDRNDNDDYDDDDDGYDDDDGNDDDSEDEEVDPEVDDTEFRKNFPESWIFETIEVGSSEQTSKTFTVPDSMTSWDISAFSINNNDGLAIMKPQELIVINEFFIKVNLPYSIRYKEVLKVDVLIYNYMENYEELKVIVELKINENFQIVSYLPNCTLIADQNNTRTASVPHMDVQKVSFYIQADSTNFEAKMSIIKLLIDAKGISESGYRYQDTLQKELKVEPFGLRLYDVDTYKFYLDKSTSTSRSLDFSGSNEYARYSAVVSGSYLSDDDKLKSIGESISNNLEDEALSLKKSYEVYRYFKSKGQKISSDIVNVRYQNIMSILSKSWVKPSIPFRIVYVDVLASLMNIHVLSTNKIQIQEQFDAIKRDFFDKIGTKTEPWFEEKIESESFKVAFALIPFIKLKSLLDVLKRYDSEIAKGINYLKNNEEILKNDPIGLSIAAYVHAINGDAETAQKQLLELEKLTIKSKSSQKCYKLGPEDSNCDILVTSYTALTYMKLNNTQEATTIFNWLIESSPIHKFSVEHAVLAEAIAEIGLNLKNQATNLKINLNNNLGNQTVVDIKNDQADPNVIDFTEYTQNISTTITGTGFCSVSIVTETMQTVPRNNPKFSITIEAHKDKGKGTVKVCGIYSSDESDRTYIKDVFYEIELPTGYVCNGCFEEIDDNHDIMQVLERRKGTIVSVYFHDFQQSKQYCVILTPTKMFTVKESTDAAVRVYDYSDKANNDVQFYRFSDEKC